MNARIAGRAGRVRGAAGLLTLLAAAACSSTPMPLVVDRSLAEGEVYEVQGMSNRTWGEPLKFGAFSTRKTKVGESWQWSSGFFGVGAGQRVQPYRFVFVGEAESEWQVECRANTPILAGHSDDGEWSVPIGETHLGCVMRASSGGVHALRLGGNAFDLQGESNVAGLPITIRTLHELPDKNGNPHRIPFVLGYELRQGDRVVGSIDLQGHGRVYIARDLPPEVRNGVALTATSLMFFGQS